MASLDFPVFGGANAATGDILTYPKHIMLGILKSFFSSPDLMGAGQNEWKYVANEEGEIDPRPAAEGGSRLQIVDTWAESLESQDSRPALVVARGDVSFSGFGFDKGQTGIGSKDAYGDTHKFADIATIPVTISAIDRFPVPTDRLAVAATLALRLFHPIIRKRAPMVTALDLPTVGAPFPAKVHDGGDRFVVRIETTFKLSMAWTLKYTEVRPVGALAGQVEVPDPAPAFTQRFLVEAEE